MPVDLTHLKMKLEDYKEVRTGIEPQHPQFKPEMDKTYDIRLLPLVGPNKMIPSFCYEAWIYFNLPGKGYVQAPSKLMQPQDDPIKFAHDVEINSGNRDSKFLTGLTPKLRCISLVIVRGEEEKGPQLWTYNHKVYRQIIQGFVDANADLSDPQTGRDISVKKYKPNDPNIYWTEMDVAIKSNESKLASDWIVSKWLDDQIELESLYKIPSFSELEEKLYEYYEENDHTPSIYDEAKEQQAWKETF